MYTLIWQIFRMFEAVLRRSIFAEYAVCTEDAGDEVVTDRLALWDCHDSDL